MKEDGYVVMESSNGIEALEVLSKLPEPCLVLLDLMMPEMDGWALLDSIKKECGALQLSGGDNFGIR